MRNVINGKMDKSRRLRRLNNLSSPLYSIDRANQDIGAVTMARYWAFAQNILAPSVRLLNSKTYPKDQKATVSMKTVKDIDPTLGRRFQA
jgi:hypothetical protein